MSISCIRAPVVLHATILLATVFAGACSAGRDAPVERVTEPNLRQALLLSSAPAPPDRSCHIVREELPPADQLIDSVAVTDEMRRLEPSSVLLSIKFDTLGVPEFVRIIEGDGARAERLAEVAERELRQQAESDAWRLKLVSGPDPTIRVGYSEYCRPHLVDQEAVKRALSDAGVREPGRTMVLFKVGEGGRAVETRIRYHTGEFDTRLSIREVGEHVRFNPALIDGFPVTVWVSLAINTVTSSGPAWSRGID